MTTPAPFASRARRGALCSALLLAAVGWRPAPAQDLPSGTIRVMVSVPPGGPLDTTGRLFAEHLAAAWKQPAIVENRPGAATFVATKAIAQTRPDGLTVLINTSSISSYSALVKNPGFELSRDLSFIALLARLPQFLAVSSESGLNSLEDIIALYKAKPGTLNFGIYGGTTRVLSELTNSALGIKAQAISSNGAAPAVQALVRGELTYQLETMSTFRPLRDGGRVKVLAVTDRNRSPAAPEVPTLAELGYKTTDFGVWYAVVGPPGMAPAIVDKYNREVVAFVRAQRTKATLEPLGFTLTASTPQELRQIALRDEETFQSMAKALNLQPE